LCAINRGDFAEAFMSIMAIALGALIGTALHLAVDRGAEEIAQFSVALAALSAGQHWPRVIHRARERFRGTRPVRHASTTHPADTRASSPAPCRPTRPSMEWAVLSENWHTK
jgi:hypothetical protein